MLRAADVWFAYDATPVLRAVRLNVPAAGIVGILGPNGSGKTTLLRVLAGTRRPQRGTVTLDGEPLATFSRPELARRMAVVPQETHLAFDYTVAEVTMMGRYPHLGAFEIEGPADLAVAREALRATGTQHLESRPFNTLSGGEKQRVVIAGALSQLEKPENRGPLFLLLDEPTASLDLAYQLEIRSILQRLNDERQLTIAISTHDLNLAASLCRELILLDRGTVLAAGSTAAMLDSGLIRQLYGVDVDITTNPRTGRPVVVPVARAEQAPPA